MKKVWKLQAQAGLAALCSIAAFGVAIEPNYSVANTVLSVEAAASGQWLKNSVGWWYQYADGSYPASSWRKIENHWYYFNERGYMKTGWLLQNEKWYFLRSSGAMATGWVYADNSWYFMNNSGVMQTGWITVNGIQYYLNSNGAMASSCMTDKGYVDASGALVEAENQSEVIPDEIVLASGSGSRSVVSSSLSDSILSGAEDDLDTVQIDSGASVSLSSSAAGSSSSSSAYDQKVSAFLSDGRFKNGVSYGSSQMPYLSSVLAYGCAAYANDFCWSVFGKANAMSGEAFSNINEIRNGDILRLSIPHTVIVLYRDGDKLITAEGNVNGKVLVSETRWSIVNGKLYRSGSLFTGSLISGYHNQ